MRTMAEATRAGQVAKKIVGNGIEVLSISEARWKGMGSVTMQSGETVVYSGDELHQGGALMEWMPISKRIITEYAPTNDAVNEEKDEFYNQLQYTVSSCNRHEKIVVMCDMNAIVGNNNTNREEVMGKFGIGDMNDNREIGTHIQEKGCKQLLHSIEVDTRRSKSER